VYGVWCQRDFSDLTCIAPAYGRLHGLPCLACYIWVFVAGLIPDIIDAFPDVKIVGSKVALMYLKGLTNRDFTQHPVKGGDKIDLGQGVSPEPSEHCSKSDLGPHTDFC